MTTVSQPAALPAGAEDRSISMGRANLYALLLIPPMLLLALPFWLIWGAEPIWQGLDAFTRLVPFLIVLVVGILIHELLHAAGWILAARIPVDRVRLGFQLKTLTPYAHCSDPIEVNAYRIGAAAPGVILGLLPVALATIIGDGWLLVAGSFFSLAAVGDLMILLLIRDVAPGRRVLDHAERAGCYVLS